MLPRTVLFYWSKGAGMRRKMISFIGKCKEKNKPCFLNVIAKQLGVTHVAVKKHLDLLVEEGYVKQINPDGKPVYLELTKKGEDVLNKLKK